MKGIIEVFIINLIFVYKLVFVSLVMSKVEVDIGEYLLLKYILFKIVFLI